MTQTRSPSRLSDTESSSNPTPPEAPQPSTAGVSRSAAFRASASELSDATARLLYGCIHVKPVSLRRSQQTWSVAPRHGRRADQLQPYFRELRASWPHRPAQPLPQISFLNRPRLPTRLQHLVGGERTACLHQRSSCFKCLLGRQGLLRLGSTLAAPYGRGRPKASRGRA